MGFLAPVAKFFVVAFKASKTFAFFVKLVAFVGLNAISSKLFGPDIPKEGFSGPQVTVRSSVEFRKKVYGQALISGPITYNNLSGANGDSLWYQIALCEGEIEDVVEVHFDGDVILKGSIAWTAGSAGADGTGTGVVSTAKYVGKDSTTAAYIRYHLGHADQVVSTSLAAAFTDITSNHRLRGVAHVTAQLVYVKKTEDVWKGGSPGDIAAVVKGSKIYDRRKDAINLDPDFDTANKAIGNGLRWFSDGAQSAVPSTEFAFASSTATLTSSTLRGLISERVDVDTLKRYIVAVDARDTTGTPDLRLGVIFYDSNGDIIDSGTSDGTGWNSITGNVHYVIAHTELTASFVTYSGDFGAGGTASIPTGSVRMAIQVTCNSNAEATTVSEYQDATIYEYVATRHDFSDDTTWEWSDNPSMCLADYMTQVQGVAYARIGWDTFIASANHDDELVPVPPAASPQNTEKRFTCNGVISYGDSHKDNLDKILSANDGFLTRSQGVWKLRSSKWETPAYTVTQDDLAGSIQVRGSAPATERFNTIIGVFIDPERNYDVTEFPHVSTASYVTRDNSEVKKRDLTLPMTNSVTMAQRVAYRLLERGNNQQTIQLPMNTKGAKIGVGDVVNLDLVEMDWTAGENLILRSEELDHATWVDITTPVRTANAEVSPFGSLSADTLEDNHASAFEGVRQTITIPDDSDKYVVSLYLKKSDTNLVAGVNLALNGGTAVNINWRIDPSDASTQTSSSQPNGWDDAGQYWRIWTTITNNGTGNTSLVCTIYPATRTTVGGGDDTTLTGSNTFYGVQIERVETGEPTPYKKTEGTAVTTEPKKARVIEWERGNDGIYSLTLRNDDQTDYADPDVSEYGIESSASLTEGADAVPAPTSLSATSVVGGVKVDWTDPPARLYTHIEVWAGSVNSLSSATKIATVPNAPYFDTVSNIQRFRYYWIRAVRDEAAFSDYVPNNSPDTTDVFVYPQIQQQALVADPFIRLGASYWDLSDAAATYLSTSPLSGINGTDVIELVILSGTRKFFAAARRGPDEWDALAAQGMAVEVRYRLKVSDTGGGSWSGAPHPIIRVTDEDGTSNTTEYTTSNVTVLTDGDLGTWFDLSAVIVIDSESAETPPRYLQVGMGLNTSGIAYEFEIDFIDATIITGKEFAGAASPGMVPLPTSELNYVLQDDGTWTPQAGGIQKYKTADQSKSSDTTLADDTHLAGWNLEADKLYSIEGFLRLTAASTTPDIKFTFQFSNTPQLSLIYHRMIPTTGAKAGASSLMTSTTSVQLPATVTNSFTIRGTFQANATTGGTLDFQWAQNSSSIDPTQVLKGSWIRITELGPD